MTITVPRVGMVLLIGASSSGKSTFARRHFKPTEIVSSDALRALVADSESSMRASRDAFELLHAIAMARLRHHRLTVIDATNVRADARRALIDIARSADVPVTAIVFALPEATLMERTRERTDRRVPEATIRAQHRALTSALPLLVDEGYRTVVVLRSDVEVEELVVTRSAADR